ncbi:hypothetical protein [Silvanigrella aquatica]|uniref:Glycine zipper domain-containing protein n=1 Tax=Silvanigrella aquatica TaxID=1915309 RepID=A0A1L4D2X3_9BACT|nr:hypothetical protein [Silvanigrella aquatica]APJ04550.1 hypothetical protein AXG55_11795 [Silvanigrella aquatica]
MKKIFNRKVKIILSSCLLLFPTFQVAQAQCEVGSVLFRDTLLGSAVGLGVGALVMVANQSSTNIAPNLATATLIGAGAGVIIGVVELSLSDCSSSRRSAYASAQSGFKARPLLGFTQQKSFESIPNSSRDNDFSFDNFKKMSMGINLSYTFDN